MGVGRHVTGVHNAGRMLTARDSQLVHLVGRFGQASSSHIREVLFPGLSSTTFDRSVSRLLDARYLYRVGRRASGESGGASPFVYQLGVKGWQFCGMAGGYQRSNAVNEHSLQIADTYVLLVEAERAGVIKILGFELEQSVGGGRADAWVEIGVVGRGHKFQYFLEVDLGSERPIRIEEKCAAYWSAYVTSEEEYWPYVAFVVADERRRREIGRILGSLPPERQALFRVLLSQDLVAGLLEP
jgi:hypothetical protein